MERLVQVYDNLDDYLGMARAFLTLKQVLVGTALTALVVVLLFAGASYLLSALVAVSIVPLIQLLARGAGALAARLRPASRWNAIRPSYAPGERGPW